VSFWEENKRLCYGVLGALVVLLVLWPRFKEGWPAVIRFFATDYGSLATKEEERSKKIEHYYDKKNRRMSSVISDAKRFNGELSEQYRELINHTVFIPPMPFKIASWEPWKGLKFLDIQTKTHTTNLLRYTSLRDVAIGDEFFGLDQHGVPPEKGKLPLLLRQLAMIDDLVRKATDCGVRQIGRVIAMSPMKTGPLNRPHFLAVCPVRMEIAAPVESIMRFVNSLDGYQGKVTSVGTEVRQEDGKAISEQFIVIDVGRDHGLSRDHAITFTIFDEVPDKQDALRYKGRAYVQEVRDDSCKAIIPKNALPPVDEKELENRKIAKGDLATTNFYTLLDLKIEAEKPKAKNSLKNNITCVVTVGAAGLLEEARTIGTTGPGKRPSKSRRPPRTWRGGY